MKKLILTFSLLICATLTFAQWGDEDLDESASWRERIFVGGGMGLSFSNYRDYVSVSPLVGYQLTPKLAAGVGVSYQYTNYKQVTPRITASDYGATLFARYMVYNPFFLHAEYEHLNYIYGITNGGTKLRDTFDSFMAGGGLFQPMGSRAGFFALVLYNFSYISPQSTDRVTPYNSPWVIRAGVTTRF